MPHLARSLFYFSIVSAEDNIQQLCLQGAFSIADHTIAPFYFDITFTTSITGAKDYLVETAQNLLPNAYAEKAIIGKSL